MSPATPTWAGIWPAALTMFTTDGDLDETATADHLDWLIGQGCDGLIVGGTSGEFVAMTDHERQRLCDLAVEVGRDRVPVITGSGCYGTAASIALTRHAAEAGADGALIVLPYFQRPSRTEILDHYRAIAAAVDIPLMVYNIPANAAVDPVSVADLAVLHREGAIAGVKSTGPMVQHLSELRNTLGDGFRAFYGGTTLPLEALAGGAHGWVSGLLNVVPAAAVQLWNAVQQGDLGAARTVWDEQWRYRRLLSAPAVPGTSDLALYRGLLRIWGRPAGHCRPPLRDLTPDELRTVERALD